MVAPGRDRLRRAFGLSRPPAAGAPAERRDDLRAFLQRRQLQFAAAPRPVVELPAGDEVATPLGTFWRRQLRYPLAHRHGAVALAAAAGCRLPALAALARSERLAAATLAECLLLDTETTGLGGGAGTIVFAIGVGWFEADAFVLEQSFLRGFGDEPAMLWQLNQQLQQRPVLVTYVGKSFDRHRLAARMAVHKLGDAAVLGDRHFDLYHLARRAFGRKLPDCRLRTLEQLQLDLWRQDDLPGSEAPQAFLDWIRDRTGPVDRVLEHNRLDVLSVAALLAVLAPGSAAGAASAPDQPAP